MGCINTKNASISSPSQSRYRGEGMFSMIMRRRKELSAKSIEIEPYPNKFLFFYTYNDNIIDVFDIPWKGSDAIL